jgi:hypothetical protein
MQVAKSVRTVSLAVATLLALLAVAWSCIFIGLLGYAFPFLAIGSFAYLLSERRWLAATAYVVLLPTTVAFLEGIVDYTTGKARLQYSGLPGTKFYNLDPHLRCRRATYGCVVYGNEWLSQAPYNGAVRLLIATVGFMPGTYTGPYPTEEEAFAAVDNATPIFAGDLSEDRVIVGKEEVRLDKGVGSQLLAKSFFPVEADNILPGKTMPTIRATIWHEECVLLRIPFAPLNDESDSAMVVVLSRRHGRPFAYYGIGKYQHRFPPVPWQGEE